MHANVSNSRSLRLSALVVRLAAVLKFLNVFTPLADLAVRWWVAYAFFLSGLSKAQSFESTIALFTYEYEVPILPPVVAAYLGTFTELVFPVLLALGLAGRFSAAVLFAFNIVAVLSYPALNDAGIAQHQVWGLMLLVSLLHGPGKLSIDHFISQRILKS